MLDKNTKRLKKMISITLTGETLDKLNEICVVLDRDKSNFIGHMIKKYHQELFPEQRKEAP